MLFFVEKVIICGLLVIKKYGFMFLKMVIVVLFFFLLLFVVCLFKLVEYKEKVFVGNFVFFGWYVDLEGIIFG